MGTQNSTRLCTLCRTRLGDTNRTNEHAIPRGIGGRVKSDQVTCSRCNNRTSNGIDKQLTDAYSQVRHFLSDFMPADVPRGGMPGKSIFLLDGKEFKANAGPIRPEPSDMYVVTANDKTKAVIAMNDTGEKIAGRTAEEIGKGKHGTGGYQTRQLGPGVSQSAEFDHLHSVWSVGVQCGALKAGILALAALGAETHGVDFTSPMFDTIRQTITAANDTQGTDGARVQIPTLPNAKFGVCLGPHQSLLQEMLRLRKDSNLPVTDFEHFILLSGNAATRTIELFVVLFSAHVFAFRLTNDWQGGDKTLLAVNGIMKECHASQKLENLRVRPLAPHNRIAIPAPKPASFSPQFELASRATAYWYRHSDSADKRLRDGVAYFGTLDAAVSKLIDGLYGQAIDGDRLRAARNKVAVKSSACSPGAPSDGEIGEAANNIADLIDGLADQCVYTAHLI